MPNLDADKQYEQWNLRSRWYSSQLWYIPFAFLGIIALALSKLTNLDEPVRTFAFLMLSFFSLAIYVQVTSLKFYERKAVLAMQKLEDPVVSGGGGCWYLSFSTYVKVLSVLCALGFLWLGSSDWSTCIHILLFAAVTVIVVCVWYSDWTRTKTVLDEIRKNLKPPNATNV